MIKIALFASGSGSNAENIFCYFNNQKALETPLIITNNAHAYVLERAKKLQIPAFVFSKEDFKAGEPIVKLLKQHQIDGIVLAGFMLKIPSVILQAFPDKIINIHPALLPKYGGKGMYGQHVHEAVKAAGETETGITIHYVNDHYDAGNIIFQAKCDIAPTDTPDDIAQKVHALEYEYYPLIIEKTFGEK